MWRLGGGGGGLLRSEDPQNLSQHAPTMMKFGKDNKKGN